MITKAYIQEYGNNKMEPEQVSVMNELKARGIPVQLFTQKLLDRRRLSLNPETLVVGDVTVVLRALKYLGINDFNQNSYPKSLASFYHRTIWESSVKKMTNELYNGEFVTSVFVKPKYDTKKFTGFVLDTLDDLRMFKGASRGTILYCATPVTWLSEYRVYVLNGEIVGIGHYEGDKAVELDMNVIEEAIQVLEKSDEKTVAYGIDFGVLGNGKTALIEWNDAFSLGNYGLSQKLYTDLIMARWNSFFNN